MWFPLILVILFFSTAESLNYDKATRDLLSKFNSMNDVPLSKDIGKLSRFKEELSEFSKSIVTLAESFAKSLNESKPDIEPISNMTSSIRERIIHLTRNYSLETRSISFRFLVSNYLEAVSRSLSGVLLKLQLLSLDTAIKDDVDRFVKMCTDKPGFINYQLEEMAGYKCLDFTFSQRAASVLSTLIYSSKIATYELTIEENEYFNDLYYELYFYLQEKLHIDTSSFIIQLFLRDNKDKIYENKVKLLEDVSKLFDLPLNNELERDCFPMTAFIHHHFNRDIWLQIGDILIGDIYASKFVTRMCANITHYGNSTAAEEYLLETEENLGYVYTVITEWLESLMESTWPTTETELISGFMKEASEGLPIPENAAEYQKVANYVHDKVKSIGHPRYYRHYLISKEHKYYDGLHYPSSHRDFDLICNKNICSHVASVGAQCATIRTEREKAENERNAPKNLTYTVKPQIMEALKTHYYNNNWYTESMALHLRSDPDIESWFRNHTSFTYLHSCKYWRDCKVLYGFKSEEGEQPQSVQFYHYHNDGTLFSNCHDSLLIFGV